MIKEKTAGVLKGKIQKHLRFLCYRKVLDGNRQICSAAALVTE